MKTTINLEEKIGKSGGPRTAPYDPLAFISQKELARLRKKTFVMPCIPRGVFYFKSHEEADAWLMNLPTRSTTRQGLAGEGMQAPAPGGWLDRLRRWLTGKSRGA